MANVGILGAIVAAMLMVKASSRLNLSRAVQINASRRVMAMRRSFVVGPVG